MQFDQDLRDAVLQYELIRQQLADPRTPPEQRAQLAAAMPEARTAMRDQYLATLPGPAALEGGLYGGLGGLATTALMSRMLRGGPEREKRKQLIAARKEIDDRLTAATDAVKAYDKDPEAQKQRKAYLKAVALGPQRPVDFPVAFKEMAARQKAAGLGTDLVEARARVKGVKTPFINPNWGKTKILGGGAAGAALGALANQQMASLAHDSAAASAAREALGAYSDPL